MMVMVAMMEVREGGVQGASKDDTNRALYFGWSKARGLWR